MEDGLSRFGLFAAPLAAALLAAPALADVTVEEVIGHNGRWVSGAATPVAITLSNNSAEPVSLRLDLSVGERVAGSDMSFTRPVFLGPNATRREVLLIPGPTPAEPLTLSVAADPVVTLLRGRDAYTRGRIDGVRLESVVSSELTAVPYECRVIGVVGDDRNVLMNRLPQGSEKSVEDLSWRHEEVYVLSVAPEDVRLAPFALEGIDSLVVCDPDASFCAAPQEVDALLDWVALGGHLVISLADRAASFATSPLAREMPALWAGVESRDYAPMLQGIASSESPRAIPSRQGPWVRLRDAETPGSLILRSTGGTALRAVRTLGRGRVTLLPLDVRLGALQLVEPKHELRPLLDLVCPRCVPTLSAFGAANMWTSLSGGRLDLGSELATVLQSEAFSPPPAPLVLLGLIAYVLVVGPLDWFILKRFGKQRLTTLTFSGAVLGFTILAYGLSLVVFSTGAVVNRLQLVDLVHTGREGRELIRVIDVAGYYSPTGADRRIAFSLPSFIGAGTLPGGVVSGSVGQTISLSVGGNDPLHPDASLSVAFRSQRTVRTTLAGPAGRSIEVRPAGDGFEVTNGLPVDLDAAWILTPDGRSHTVGAVPSGGSATSAAPNRDQPGSAMATPNVGLGSDVTPDMVRALLAFLSQARRISPRPAADPTFVFQRLGPEQMTVHLKSGIDQSEVLDRGDALLVAYASASPVPVPGQEEDGATHTVIRKEVRLK